MNNLKPSHFTAQPWNSIAGNSESEVIARNIMMIRKRRGDVWPLAWAEYKAERQKDGNFSEREKQYFDKVIKLIPDAIGAINFCKEWADAARKAK